MIMHTFPITFVESEKVKKESEDSKKRQTLKSLFGANMSIEIKYIVGLKFWRQAIIENDLDLFRGFQGLKKKEKLNFDKQ